MFKRFKDVKNETDYLNYSLTNVEREIHSSLILDNVNSIKIESKNGDEYILDKEFILSSEKEMKMLLNKLSYADATSQVRGNKTIYKLTEKKKIKQ